MAAAAAAYLVLFEHPVDEQAGLLLHVLGDGVSHGVVRLQAALEGRRAVLIIHVLLGVPGEKGEWGGEREKAPSRSMH